MPKTFKELARYIITEYAKVEESYDQTELLAELNRIAEKLLGTEST